MAVVIAKSAAALAKALIRRNVAGVIETSTKGMLSQAKVADHHHHDDMYGVHDREEVEHILPLEESYRIHMNTIEDTLKINLEHVSNGMQKELIEQLGPQLQATVDAEQIPIVSFNYLAEEIFINNLYMTFRKLGYEGSFTRYNNDKGIATFKMVDPEEENTFMRKYSYFRSGQPNLS